MKMHINEKLLMIALAIIIVLLTITFFQNNTLTKYRNLLNNVDTTAVVIKDDTIDVSTDTTIYKPVIIKETLLRVDTLYNNDGDTIEVKKKIKLIPMYW